MNTNDHDKVKTNIDDAAAISEVEKYDWAVAEQGFGGSYEDWQNMSAAEREEYESGARGEGTS